MNSAIPRRSASIAVQGFLHEVPAMSPRDVAQRAEDGVPDPLIEGPGLEAHCVQVRMVAAAPRRFPLGHGEQGPPVALTAQPFGDPQDLDDQPAPIRRTEQSADDAARGVAQHDAQRLEGVVLRLRAIIRRSGRPGLPG